MSLRVLHILDHSIPLHSGYTFRTVSLLREQRRLGWETFHLTSPKHMGPSVTDESVDGWHFYRTATLARSRLPLPGVHEWGLMEQLERRITQVAAEVRPHVIHAHSPVLNGIPALRAGRRMGIPVVYEVRAFWEDAAVDHGTTREGSMRYRLTRAMETWALRRAGHVFTICEGLRQDIVARGIPANRITVIPNAVNLEDFSIGSQVDVDLQRQLGLEGRTVVGFIGSFYAYEGLDLLLEALPALLQRRPDVRVLLVGGGPQESALRAQALQLGVSDAVIFTGRVPHQRVQAYYDLVDVLAYPRHAMRLTELVTPLKPLEAMAQGRLFVASDVGGHRELIRHDDTGWLFQAGSAPALLQALDGLLGRRDDWPRLVANGRRYVETERHWARSVQGYLGPYQALAGAVP